MEQVINMKTLLQNIRTKINNTISTIDTEFQSIGLAPQESKLMSLAQTLLSMLWLLFIVVYLLVTLTGTMIKRVAGLFSNIGMPGLSIQYVVSRLVSTVRRVPSVFKRQKNKNDLVDKSLYYTEMPVNLRENEQLRKAMKAPIDLDKIRKGL